MSELYAAWARYEAARDAVDLAGPHGSAAWHRARAAEEIAWSHYADLADFTRSAGWSRGRAFWHAEQAMEAAQ